MYPNLFATSRYIIVYLYTAFDLVVYIYVIANVTYSITSIRAIRANLRSFTSWNEGFRLTVAGLSIKL